MVCGSVWPTDGNHQAHVLDSQAENWMGLPFPSPVCRKWKVKVEYGSVKQWALGDYGLACCEP